MKKDLAIIFGLFLLIAGLLVFGKGFTSADFLPTQRKTQDVQKKGDTVVTAGSDFKVDAKVVSKASDRKKGLSKVESLPLNQGMLFVFEASGLYPFWMKDMKFAIDIVWIDEGKRIVSIAENVPPEPGKKDKELSLYRPSGDALYVLEVNAGLTQLHGLRIGDIVNFEL